MLEVTGLTPIGTHSEKRIVNLTGDQLGGPKNILLARNFHSLACDEFELVMSSPETRPRGVFIHAKPAYLDVWPVPPRLFNDNLSRTAPTEDSNQLFSMSGFFLLQLACLVGRAPDVRRRRVRPIQIRVFVSNSELLSNALITKRVKEVLQGLRIEMEYGQCHVSVHAFLSFPDIVIQVIALLHSTFGRIKCYT
ncbi:hypothetical protein ACTXT7_015625 [Hymenolepis weldensis]